MDKQKYQQKIHVYLIRREKYKRNFKGPGFFSKTKRYRIFNNKLSAWRKQIRKIDARIEKVDTLKKAVNKYFSVDISSEDKDKTTKIALFCYFKYGLENGFSGTYLTYRVKIKRRQTASEWRKRFNKSFATNRENKNSYHDFKNWYESKYK